MRQMWVNRARGLHEGELLAESPNGQGVRLLFVDDNPGIRRAFARTMKRYGFDVDLASGATDAVELASSNSYRVITTDISMPEQDGLTLLERLKPIQPDAAFVVVTGLPESDQQRERSIYDAVTSVLSKPWHEKELIGVLQKALVDREEETTSGQDQGEVLLVADSEQDATAVAILLRRSGVAENRITCASRLSDAIDLLNRGHFDVVLSELALQDAVGLRIVREMVSEAPDTAIIVLTDDEDENRAIESIRLGAQDFLIKGGFDSESLSRAIRHATERKHADRRLRQLVHMDQLTGLSNRTTFRRRLTEAVARSHRTSGRFALILVNLDRFKRINDSLGNQSGDVLLQVLGNRFRVAAGDSAIVARLGGDEFGLIIEGDEAQDDRIDALAERLRVVAAEPAMCNGTQVVITASIGVAEFPDTGTTEEAMMRSADDAEGICKRRGGNSYHRSSREERRTPSPRLKVESDLRAALKRREFFLHYQPIFSLQSDRVVSLEALLRWNRDGSIISPAVFIPILEETGLIDEVGEWVLDTACIQLREWQQFHGPGLRLSVNLSPRQFDRSGLVDVVRAAIARSGIEPDTLELEITEGVMMRDTQTTRDILEDLKGLDVRLAIDDFGTGYSSLSYLQRFSVDTLKIDRSFIANLARGKGDASIVSAVIDLGHHLEMDVVAEGVETAEQLEFLRNEGCDLVQGFYLGRPAAEWDG